MDILEFLPKGWSQQQCETCELIFVLPPSDDLSRITAQAILAEELERHVQQNHIALPSAREATSITELDDVIVLARE